MHHNKIARPISRILMLGTTITSFGVAIYIPTTSVSAVLITILGIVILSTTVVLKPIKDVYSTYKPKASELNRHAVFAGLYLKDKQLQLTRVDFEKSLRNDWYDVITAYILLGYLNDKTEFTKAVTICMRYNSLKSLTVLINSGKKMDSEPANILFKEALFKETMDYMELLFKLDVNLDYRDSEGDTFLIIATRNNLEEPVQFLIDNGASWNITNVAGDSPLFIALANQYMNIYRKLLARVEKNRSAKHLIERKTFSERIILEKRKDDLNPLELINRIIPAAKESMLPIFADYLNHKEDYQLDIKNKYELYVRKSNIFVEIITAVDSTKNPIVTIGKDRYTQDIIDSIHQRYSFCMEGQFYIESVYETPKCIESERVVCSECNGTAELVCSECEGEGYIICAVCKGKGHNDCPECGGKGEVNCEHVKKYKECNNCKNGEYSCLACNKDGEQVCPICEGHGTKKCTCPSGKKIKCTRCTNGTIIEFDGGRKKCTNCEGGLICTLCNGTKWVLTHYVDQGYACKTCRGKTVLNCRVCKGKKKIKCRRLFKEACTCKNGEVSCKACGTKGRKLCHKCLGERMKPCRECDKGYKFNNTYADFKAYNAIEDEILISNDATPILGDLLASMPEKIITQHPYLTTLYTGVKVMFHNHDIYLSPDTFKQKLMQLAGNKNPDSIIDIIEMAPLEYQEIKFYKKGREVLNCIIE
ncbi:hypothetical protein AN640_03980 [Candidatus Epulonipiscium fishelsonii]|uniref:Uncharacterized protein n=1 Tax=Candidatus Epulonipiscium fishelsonii TaxID=77094 RepID=A0ACC8XIN3_9FIRM|nr:hypothetical protein AN640_03980 [Epulopiscium sp. SCG-D08WGA-EpuloA1]